jgi:hypothetical protein
MRFSFGKRKKRTGLMSLLLARYLSRSGLLSARLAEKLDLKIAFVKQQRRLRQMERERLLTLPLRRRLVEHFHNGQQNLLRKIKKKKFAPIGRGRGRRC